MTRPNLKSSCGCWRPTCRTSGQSPRRQRHGPYLAGMAWDGLVLAGALLLRLLGDRGIVNLPLPGLPAVVALLAVTNLGWQCMRFLRTDLYAVMVNLLGCRNLLHLKQKLRGINAADLTLATVPPARSDFWLALLVALLTLLQLVWPAGVYLRQRDGARRPARS